MDCRENLKDAFEKLYRESVQEFENKSKDLFFNKSKLVMARQKMHVLGKESNFALLAVPSKEGSKKPLKDQSDNKTWKTTIFKRKKPPSPSNKTKVIRHQKENLKNSIDRIFFDHLFGQKKLTGNSGYPASMTRKNASFILTRNIKNVDKQKSQSVSESKINFISDSKITTRKKKAVSSTTHPARESLENSLELFSYLPFLDDSGVFGEDLEPGKDDENVSLVNKMYESPRKRSMSKDDSGGQYSKKLRSLVHMTKDLKTVKKPGGSESDTLGYGRQDYAKELNQTPTSDKSKRQMTENSNTTKKPGDRESKITKGRPSALSEKFTAMPRCSKPVAKEKRQGFQPLFSHHCGGIWKAIVNEN